MKAEILNVNMETYVRDDFATPPSLSSGLAHLLLTRSPAHAWWHHPRLNPAWAPDDDRAFDVGNAAHGVLLEGRDLFVVDFPDFRTKQAQAVRDEAKRVGKLPVLPHQAEAITRMVENARAKIAASPDLVDLGELLPERSIRWQDGESWLRCRPDIMTYDHAILISVKTTRASAHPDAFQKTLIGSGYDMQMAFECAGITAVTGVEPKYLWCVIECEEPYAVSLVGPEPTLVDHAQQRMRAAVNQWAYCLAENQWPAYPDRIAYVDLPQWAAAKWMEQAPVVDDGRPLADQLAGEEKL